MEDGRAIGVLLVEDSENHAAMIRAALEGGRRPVALTAVRRLDEARARLAGASFDLAIVDLLLPDGRGSDLLVGELACPVVIMTGQGDEAAAVAAMKAGAVDYVVKSAATLAELPQIVGRALGTWRHIIERRRAEAALMENRRRYQELVETLNDWVWEVDGDGVYTYTSPNVREILGYAPEEVVGRTPFDFMPESEAGRVAALFREAASRREPFRGMANTNRHKRGHEVVLETSGVPYYASDGSFAGYRGVDRDITERKRAEEQLRQANRELASFSHTLAHDLRLPLTAIIGFSELLQERYVECLDPEGLEMVATIQQQGVRMQALMEDLLTLARVGRIGRPATPVSADAVLEEVLLEFASHCAEGGVAVQAEPLPEVRVPGTLLAQMFENLLGNALRYAARPGDAIEVGGRRREGTVQFYVRDHGPGIPENERGEIFEPFCRGAAGRQLPGTGIGLAIVHKVARLCDGRAWVEETPGGGSTFWVELADDSSGE